MTKECNHMVALVDGECYECSGEYPEYINDPPHSYPVEYAEIFNYCPLCGCELSKEKS